MILSQNPSNPSSLKMLLTAAAVVVIIAGLQAAGAIILPILVAIFLAVICMPPVAWLQRKGFPDWAAVVVVFIAVFVVFIGLSFVVTSSIAQFQTQLPLYEDRLQEMFNGVVTWLQSHGIEVSSANVREQFDSKRLTGLITRGLSAFTMVLSNTFLVMLTVVFVLSEAAGMPRKIRAMVGDPDADVSWSSNVLGDLRTYLAVKTQCSLMIAIPVTIMLKLVGVDYAILWGLLAFLLNYIPNLGSIIAAIPPILLTLLMMGLGWGIAVAIGYLAFNFIVGNMLEPRMMGRRLGLSTLVVFLSMVFWGWVWGPVGMVLSVPLTMIVKILLEHTEDLKWVAILLGSAPEGAECSTGES